MPRQRDLTLYQGNSDTLTLSVTADDTGLPLDLTGASDIKMVVKASADATDASGTTLSKLTGEISIVSAAAGTAIVAVPSSLTAAAGPFWYRVDVLPGPKTALYGTLYVRDT